MNLWFVLFTLFITVQYGLIAIGLLHDDPEAKENPDAVAIALLTYVGLQIFVVFMAVKEGF